MENTQNTQSGKTYREHFQAIKGETSTLAGGIVYRADFVLLLPDGTYRIEDVKGVRTQTYKLKKRLMAEKGLEIVEV